MFYLAFLKPSGVAITSKNHHVHVALHAALLKSSKIKEHVHRNSEAFNGSKLRPILKTKYYLFVCTKYIHIRI